MTKRILIVEDEPVISKFLCDLLRQIGYEVLLAGDGAQAVVLARAEKPDLMLVDIQLPVMDGLAATREIKGNPVTYKIPVIALTGMAMKEDQERILAAGFNDYVAKPVHIRSLLDKIARYLRENQPAAT